MMDAKHMTKAQLSAEVTRLRVQNAKLSNENESMRRLLDTFEFKRKRRKPDLFSHAAPMPAMPTGTALRNLR